MIQKVNRNENYNFIINQFFRIMRKKNLMVAMLLGTFMLGACVDNDESASVEAVRTAKAEQLKSVAAMNNAEAEAKKLLAEAEAALTNAEAEAKKIENDREKAQLAIDMAGQEQKLEAALLDAQAALAQAKTDLADALKSADEATRTRIEGLATNYYNAVTTLNGLKRTLFTTKSSLIALENGVTTAEATLANDIAAQELIISKNTGMIETYKKSSTPAELAKALEISNANLASLGAKQTTAGLEKSYADAAQTTALTAYNTSNYKTKATTYSAYIDFGTPVSQDAKFTYTDGREGKQTYQKYPYATVDAVSFEIEVTKKEAAAKTLETPLKTAQDAYALSKKATDDAAKAWKEAAEADKAAKEAAYNSAKSTSDNDLAAVEAAQAALDAANKIAKQWREDYAYLTDTGVAAQNKLVDGLNAANKAACDALIAQVIVNDDYSKENAKNTALNNMSTATDVSQLIADCEKAIADANIKIDELKATRADKDALVAEKKAEIAALESQIQAGEANAKSAKTALDAAMAE